MGPYNMSNLPEIGYLRLGQIIGDSKSSPPTTPLIPVSSTTWWEGIKTGLYPTPIKISKNISAWPVEDIRELIERLNSKGGEAE